MPFSISWVEVHGALTHFPIASLLLVCALDCGAWLSKKPAWRESSLILLWVAVLTSPPALLSGYLTGRELSHPPVGFQSHWIVAVATSILALISLIWRVRSRDHLARHLQTVGTLITLAGAAAVSYTGYLGGQMVFGDALSAAPNSAPVVAESSVTPKTAPPSVVDKAQLKLISGGEKLFRSEDNDCLSCHKFKGEGRNKGPDLTHEALRHDSVDWHIQHLIDPEKMVPGSKMPDYADLKPEELKALATWMSSLR
jgi:uncharacterized membrane protein/cytochrome c2